MTLSIGKAKRWLRWPKAKSKNAWKRAKKARGGFWNRWRFDFSPARRLKILMESRGILKSHLEAALKARELRNQMIPMIPITSAGSQCDAM